MIKHALPPTLIAIALVTTAAPALADDPPGCGLSQASWNVPKGAVVFNSSDGPIRAVLQSVGETRTHTMLHLGGGRVAHSSMYQPGLRPHTDTGFCQAPLDPVQLDTGWPGAERMNVSAAYQVLKGSTFVYYQRGKVVNSGTPYQVDWGAAIADKVSTFPGDFHATDATIYYGYVPFRFIETLRPYGASRPHAPYSLYQYRDLENVNHGWEASDTGLVCSTFLAMAQHAYGGNGASWSLPMDVAAHPYTHDQTNAGGYALYDAVKTGCEEGNGFFGALMATAAGIGLCLDANLCDEAAAQVRNCMSYGDCYSGDVSRFDNDVSSPWFTSSSISPDWIGGWVSGQNYSGSDQSVWAWDGNHAVTWSGPGNVYDCWY